MYRVRVKVCGVTNIVDARMLEREGVDAIGFIFWPQSTRVVPADRVGKITRVLSPLLPKIGIFYDAGVAEVERSVKRTGLTGAQLCGTLPGNDRDWRSMSRRVRMIRAMTVQPDPLPEEPPWSFCYDYMFHAGTEELPGDADEPFDWSVIPHNHDESWGRIYISSGLTCENVGELIKKYRPYAVDICGVVENEHGRKDVELVREFIAAVRHAEHEIRDCPAPVRQDNKGSVRQPDGNAT